MLKKIATDRLEIGMYVSELDRPWTETNFLLQGLLLETADDIGQIQEQCTYVYIDSDDETPINHRESSTRREFGTKTITPRDGIDEILRDIPHDCRYPNTLAVEYEVVNAIQAYNKAAAVFHSIWGRVREHRPFHVNEFNPVIQNIVSSVIRNPDAFMLLRTVCDDRDYNCRHAINSCALAATFARHLGFYPEEISNVATGAFLLDIGKARLPEELLNKRGPLTQNELELLRCHTEFGVDVLAAVGDVPRSAIEMVHLHHERDNGKGYPASLDGNQIPVYARLAALVDCFDAITIERPYKKPLAACDALKIIQEANGIDFQIQFIEEFVGCLGIYPTGSVVELSNGTIATVIGQNPDNRERPQVMLLQAEETALKDNRIIIDLGQQIASPQRSPVDIRKVLPNELPNIRIKNKILSMVA
jgi:HD-GYP domain-containing protein (c-di-GMP phosphodiesterase class II)